MELILGGKQDEQPKPPDPVGHVAFSKFNTPESPILFPVGERRVGWEMRDGSFQRTNAHKAIIRLNKRGDAAQLLNIVGSTYKLVHNRELFTAVEQAIVDEMLPDHLEDVRVTDKVSGWGKVCYREYVFPNIRCKLTYNKSDIGFRMIVQNGYGGSALRIHAGAIDFYCSNGMIRGDYTASYKRHTKGLVIGDLAHTVKDALLKFADSQQIWQKWISTPVKHSAAMALFEQLAGSAKMQQGLTDQYEREQDVRGQNLWAVYSTMTYYASHNDGVFALRKSVEDADTAASTMLRRELEVARWVNSKEWKALETVKS